MATPQENLARFQEISDRGLEGRLSADKRSRFDEAVRRGLVTQRQADQQAIPQSVLPETVDINQDIGAGEAALISAGRGLTKIGRAVGLADPEDPIVTQQFQQLQEQRPISTTVGEIAGESAPFLIPGLGAPSAIAKLGGGIAARTGVVGGLGALEAGTITKGGGSEIGETLFSAGIGGTAASALELALPVIGRIGGRIIRKTLGKQPTGNLMDGAGNLSPEFTQALDKAGLTIDDIAEEVRLDLAGEVVEPNQAARKAFLESQGIDPTRAQVTRGVDDFASQQEAAKSSSRVRDALEKQEAFLTTRFNDAVIDTGGDAVTPTSTITDVLTEKATALDSQIGDLYKVAREAAPGEQNIQFKGLAQKLRDLAPSNRRTGGNIEAIVGDMQSKGILDDSFNVVGRVDVETAEDIRKLTNELFDPANPFGNMKLREIKDSLDDDVFKAAGEDVFKQARKAKFDFEKGLSRAKLSKFDSRKKNIVRDMLENRDTVNPEQFVDKVVFGKTWRASDLKQLKDYVTDGTDEAGQKAFNDLRAETLQKIKESSFIGPVDEAGNRALSRDKLDKALKSVGGEKLNILFDKKELKFLNDMKKVSELREPVRGTALGEGPTGKAVNLLRAEIRKGSIIANLLDTVTFDRKGRGVLKASPQRLSETVKDVTPSQLRSSAAQVGAIATVSEEQQ